MALQPGQMLINRYRIVRLLGQGGFGAVYRAWDANLKKPCAVKENLDTSPEAQRQFGREATVLANLSHPNLPRVTDHFSISGQGQYLVMDYVDGEDIASRVGKQGAIAVEQALEWITQVADALTYLHTRKPPVVHRDIKPANIRITPEGRAMLVDFGLVKVYDPNLQTTLGARAVTPGYAPPEQYGQGVTDGRTDIYALGATLYNILTGQEPLESVQRMVGKQMPGANQVNPRVPEWLGQVVERAMQIEPGQRYQRAGEFKAAVSRPGSTMVVKPAGDAYVRPAAVPRTVSMPAPQSTSAAPAAPVRPASQPRGRSRRPLLWIGIAVLVILCLVVSLGLGGWLLNAEQEAVNKTSAARLQKTLAERVRATSTAFAESTATQKVRATVTAGAKATLTSQAFVSPTATADLRGELIFGPISGSLEHDSEDGLIKTDEAEVDLRDFVVEARFINPYSGSVGSWDYGFIFRHEKENTQFRFVIKSDKSWKLENTTGDPNGETIDEGVVTDTDISEGGSNLIKLVINGDRGEIFLNDEFVSELNLSARMNSGTVMVGTGFYKGNEITGKLTEFTGFSIWEIP